MHCRHIAIYYYDIENDAVTTKPQNDSRTSVTPISKIFVYIYMEIPENVSILKQRMKRKGMEPTNIFHAKSVTRLAETKLCFTFPKYG